MPKPVARLTRPAEMVASLPLCLGYLPTESLVVVCCHEPRGRVGLTLRFDLPVPEHEVLLVTDVARRVRAEKATRVVLAVYTDEPDGQGRVRAAMVDRLREAFAGLTVTEAVLVRGGRFWSYLCDVETCCPREGRSVEEARGSSAVGLLQAERVLEGRAVLADRAALEASMAGPTLEAAEVAAQRCQIASALLGDAIEEAGTQVTGEASLTAWWAAVDRWRTPPARLGAQEAAALAVSLRDLRVRDQLAAAARVDVPPLLSLLAELCRRTPAPFDVPVCTLYAWVTYCQGAGAEVTIALERALAGDPEYTMAQLLMAALQGQVDPRVIRQITVESAREVDRGRERGAG